MKDVDTGSLFQEKDVQQGYAMRGRTATAGLWNGIDLHPGSGTTYAVCERKGRRWLGVELESPDAIIERLSGSAI